MPGGSFAPLLISACALAISIYGVLERRRDARRSEWLRLTGTIAELDSLFFEQAKTPDGFRPGDFADAVNSRREVLSSHALSLLPKFEKQITSAELRVLGYALSRAGYPSEAERVWLRAAAAGDSEGATPALFAHRGYGYFLFSIGRPDDARTQMRLAVDCAGSDENLLVRAVETLRFWSAEEPAAEAAALLDEARRLADRIQTPRLRALVADPPDAAPPPP
jgi:hypothetical protein